MIISDEQREENFQEYVRLLNNRDYYDVTFDEKSGGMSAVHINHQFDAQVGPFGIKKGDYEKYSVRILRERGFCIILESEAAPDGIKTPDGVIDGIIMDIKAVEGRGKWSIKDKFHDAVKKSVECVVLYFHKKELFSLERVYDGWAKFIKDKDSQRYSMTIKRVICIVERVIIEWMVPK